GRGAEAAGAGGGDELIAAVGSIASAGARSAVLRAKDGTASVVAVTAPSPGFPRSLHTHRHHVAVEIGDDPDRAGDDEKDDQHARREGQNIVRAVGPGAQM